jgi:sortase A
LRRSRVSTKRRKEHNLVSSFLLVAGIAIVLYTLGSQAKAAYLQMKVDADLVRYAAVVSETVSPESPDPASDTESLPVPKSLVELGILVIPSIDVRVRILDGVGVDELTHGVGRIRGTALPGARGNSALAGHRTSFKMHPFLNLDKVSVGDEINVLTGSETLLFEVTRVVVVAPDDVSVLKQDRTKTQLTLITCHPKGDTSQRLVVQAELVE